jgi:Gamma-glutamyltranspeptidase
MIVKIFPGDSSINTYQHVGTTFCIGVIGMYHSGLGGGGFMLVRSSNGSYEFIDFRETAPAAAFQDMYKNNTNASIFGGLARYGIHRAPNLESYANGFLSVVFPEKFEGLRTSMKTMAAFHGRQ